LNWTEKSNAFSPWETFLDEEPDWYDSNEAKTLRRKRGTSEKGKKQKREASARSIRSSG